MIDKAGAQAKLKSLEYPLAVMYIPPNILGIGRQTMMQGKVKVMENQLLLLASLYWAAVLAVLVSSLTGCEERGSPSSHHSSLFCLVC